MIAMLVKVRVKPDGKARFLKAIEVDALGSERDEPGCYRFNVLQDQQDENIYYFYEVYEDQAALEKHRTMLVAQPLLVLALVIFVVAVIREVRRRDAVIARTEQSGGGR